MIFAGCDVGALTAKAVLLRDNEILGHEVIRVRAKAVQSATDVMDKLLGKLALSYNEIDYCVGTGYGREIIPFVHDNISEISCHGRGAHWLVPSVRTIIDGGGQDYKAIGLDDNGRLKDFRMNRKCAAGTGRSIEIMADALGVDISELGPLSQEATSPAFLQQYCCFIIEIEIRHLVMEGWENADIAAGINDITARRFIGLARDLGIRKKIAVTGGIAKNIGIVRCIERRLETEVVQFPVDPQIIGALGAAVIASERAGRAA